MTSHVSSPAPIMISAIDLSEKFPDATIIDVRWTMNGPDPDAYKRGHIPGAHFADLDDVFADPPGTAGRHPLPDVDELRSWASVHGITPRTHVVVYDDAAGLPASRAWWCLKWAGVASVSILNGGLGAWTEAGLALEEGDAADPEPVDPWDGPTSMPYLTADALSETDTLIDVRTAPRYRGEEEPIDPVAGHIPTAVNIPIGNILTADGRFKSEAELTALFDALPDGRITAYCGSGITAAQFAVAGASVGVPITLYPGSWSEWITNSARTVVTGETPGDKTDLTD